TSPSTPDPPQQYADRPSDREPPPVPGSSALPRPPYLRPFQQEPCPQPARAPETPVVTPRRQLLRIRRNVTPSLSLFPWKDSAGIRRNRDLDTCRPASRIRDLRLNRA